MHSRFFLNVFALVLVLIGLLVLLLLGGLRSAVSSAQLDGSTAIHSNPLVIEQAPVGFWMLSVSRVPAP